MRGCVLSVCHESSTRLKVESFEGKLELGKLAKIEGCDWNEFDVCVLALFACNDYVWLQNQVHVHWCVK